MEKAIISILLRTEEELTNENQKVNKILQECNADNKCQPPKDYWHKQYALNNKKNILNKILEEK